MTCYTPGVGWVNVLGESRIYPNMYAKFGCGPTVLSKKGGGVGYRQTDKVTLQLYIVDCNLISFLSRPLCIIKTINRECTRVYETY